MGLLKSEFSGREPDSILTRTTTVYGIQQVTQCSLGAASAYNPMTFLQPETGMGMVKQRPASSGTVTGTLTSTTTVHGTPELT